MHHNHLGSCVSKTDFWVWLSIRVRPRNVHFNSRLPLPGLLWCSGSLTTVLINWSERLSLFSGSQQLRGVQGREGPGREDLRVILFKCVTCWYLKVGINYLEPHSCVTGPTFQHWCPAELLPQWARWVSQIQSGTNKEKTLLSALTTDWSTGVLLGPSHSQFLMR